MRNALIALIFSASAVHAGMPEEVTVTCPVGGETFEITETSSCTAFRSWNMTLAPETSCEFITRLPQCPTNRLPLYKDFSQEDFVRLPELLAEPEFKAAADLSRYAAADWLEQQLVGPASDVRFGVLLHGLWYDGERTFSDPAYLSTFVDVTKQALNSMNADDRPFFEALLAFVDIKRGSGPVSGALDAILVENGASPFLSSYVNAIRACEADPTAETCDPNAPIPE